MNKSIEDILNVICAVDRTTLNLKLCILRHVIHCLDCLMCNQINVCLNSVGSILITIPVRNVILRISLIIDCDGIISVCTASSKQRCVVIILCPCRSTQVCRNFTRREQQVVSCFLCKHLSVLKSIQHWIQFMLNMQDVVLRIQILIDNCFSLICATCAKVSNYSGKDELLNISLTVWLTITRHDQELSWVALKINCILVENVTSNFFCNVVAVFPDQDTSVSEDIRIRCQDFQHFTTQQIKLILDGLRCRGREVVRNSQSFCIGASQICVSCSNYILTKVECLIPCIQSLQNLVTNVLQFA